MMKKAHVLLPIIAMALFTVTACDHGNNPDSTPLPDSSTTLPNSSTGILWPEGYVENSGVGGKNYKQVDSKTMSVSLKQELEGEGTRCLDSLGEQRILVIPVEFTDFPAADLTGGADAAKERIQKAFFGTAEDTGWESLTSYYTKSSYGNLQLKGRVTDWFNLGISVESLLNEVWPSQPNANNGNSTWYILREAVKWYKANWEAKGWEDIKYYDQDKDGFLDAVWLVNSAAIKAYQSDDFWAFTFWDYLQEPNVDDPVAMCYASASIHFLSKAQYPGNKPDAHTMIHETGHVLGLPDYYTYDTGDWGAAGGGDMMDQNVGDHNAFSKTLYGWTNPYVVEGDAEITIRPFESTGDCIIVKNGWNGHGFDEYLILEYYTPTGLNKSDSDSAYCGTYVQLPRKSGVKIYHIDARLGDFAFDPSKGYVFQNYTDEVSTSVGVTTQMAHSNTRSRTVNNNKLIHLLEASGRNSFKDNGGQITNLSLFTKGTSIGLKTFNGFKFNDGTLLDYVIQITDVNETGATIVFNAKQN